MYYLDFSVIWHLVLVGSLDDLCTHVDAGFGENEAGLQGFGHYVPFHYVS